MADKWQCSYNNDGMVYVIHINRHTPFKHFFSHINHRFSIDFVHAMLNQPYLIDRQRFKNYWRKEERESEREHHLFGVMKIQELNVAFFDSLSLCHTDSVLWDWLSSKNLVLGLLSCSGILKRNSGNDNKTATQGRCVICSKSKSGMCFLNKVWKLLCDNF